MRGLRARNTQMYLVSNLTPPYCWRVLFEWPPVPVPLEDPILPESAGLGVKTTGSKGALVPGVEGGGPP
jgi:hypothetical protein